MTKEKPRQKPNGFDEKMLCELLLMLPDLKLTQKALHQINILIDAYDQIKQDRDGLSNRWSDLYINRTDQLKKQLEAHKDLHKGPWCDPDQYEKLEQENARLKAEIEMLKMERNHS